MEDTKSKGKSKLGSKLKRKTMSEQSSAESNDGSSNPIQHQSEAKFTGFERLPLSTCQEEFFEKEAEFLASNVTSSPYKEDPFILIYTHWLEVQPVTASSKKSCERYIREILMAHEALDGQNFNVHKWLEFDSDVIALPKCVTEILPRPRFDQNTFLGFVEAYTHMHALFRAKLSHLKKTGKFTDERFEELDRKLILEEAKLQNDFTRINKKFKEVFGQKKNAEPQMSKENSLTDAWIQDARESQFLTEIWPELCHAKLEDTPRVPSPDLEWLKNVQVEEDFL